MQAHFKGQVVIAHDGISGTATSSEIDCTGYNSLLVYVDLSSGGTPNWTITVQGCMTSGGTFVDWYEIMSTGLVQMSSGALTADTGFTFRGVPDYVKIVATENSGTGTCTVKTQPVNA